MRPERWWEENDPRIGRFTSARASSVAPPSTELKQEAIAAAPPASSPPGLTRMHRMASVPSSLEGSSWNRHSFPTRPPLPVAWTSSSHLPSPSTHAATALDPLPRAFPPPFSQLPPPFSQPPPPFSHLPPTFPQPPPTFPQLPSSFPPAPFEMWPERRWEVNDPRTGRFTPAHASLVVPPSTKAKLEAIADAPPGLRKHGTASVPSSSAGKKKHLPAAAEPPFMPTKAAAKKPVGEDTDSDHLTPLSIGSNVGRSGSSPNVSSRSPEVTTSSVNELMENLQQKWDTRQKALEDKGKELRRTIEQVQQMARECGASEKTPDLWVAVLEIIHSKRATKLFMWSDPVGRMAIIKHYAKLCKCTCGLQVKVQRKSHLKRDAEPAEDSEEEWEEEFFNILEEVQGCALRGALPVRS